MRHLHMPARSSVAQRTGLDGRLFSIIFGFLSGDVNRPTTSGSEVIPSSASRVLSHKFNSICGRPSFLVELNFLEISSQHWMLTRHRSFS